jgi:hypothetical protein
MRALRIVAVSSLCWLATIDASASSILNGGFETGTFSDWTVVPADSLIFVGGHAHSGSDAAWFGAFTADDSLLQAIDTSPGTWYSVSFWLAHGSTNSNNGFSAWWDSTPLLVLTDRHSFGYTHYTVAGFADSNTTTIRFSGHDLTDYYYLDDVSATAIPAPEPSTLVLVMAGAVTFLRRRRSLA